ncbi:hypothetical protein JBKA6_0685 [Ichthyobacterium seriolicida]|uniref:Peptidase S74 domain-containing protein n=2 Tax=Ichthyobacterium seriolicida TaxID=242600 RepID=A0A1J1DXU8_9FLAO|nr:hypothetical protein JBKA6_0685 [Ichthyobacterium seriolicida]
MNSVGQHLPNKLNYQLIARKGQELLREHTISIRISIYSFDGSKEEVLYLESHPNVKTNEYGLASIKIGDGFKAREFTDLNISSLQWENSAYYIKSEVDFNGQNNYKNAIVNKSEILSVPYAMYAANSPRTKVMDNLYSNSPTKALSANQGAKLKTKADEKLDKTYVVDNLITEDSKKALSAAQGKKLVDIYGVARRFKNDYTYSVSDIALSNGKLFSLKSQLSESEKNTLPESLQSKWLNISPFEKINSNIIMNWDRSSSTSITGNNNLVLGLNSANSLSTGSNNIVIGKESANAITTASSNISIGNKALSSNISGGDNISIGDNSLKLTNASKNIAIGVLALSENITGNGNVSIGYNAGSYRGNFGSKNTNSGSNRSIYIGQEVLSGSATAENEIVIGYRAEGKGNNTAVIGGIGIIKTYVPKTLELVNGNLDIKNANINLNGNANISGNLSASNFHTIWDANKAYSKNDIVISEGIFYKKKTSSGISSSNPSLDTANWDLISGTSTSVNTLMNISSNIITSWSGKDGNGQSGGDGTKNMFLGIDSGNDISNGSNNIAVGHHSLKSNTVGNSNVSIGNNSLYNLLSSTPLDVSGNVAIGDNAGRYRGPSSSSSNNSGSKNSIYIGADTRSADTSSTENEIVIGSGAIGKGNNTIVLGNDKTGNTYVSNGNFNITKGNLTMTKGNLNLTKGNLTLSNGNVIVKGELATSLFNTNWDNTTKYPKDFVSTKDGTLYKNFENNNTNYDPSIDPTKWQAINAGLLNINDNIITRWSGKGSNGTEAPGRENFFLGINSGEITTGSNNLAIGHEVLKKNTSGKDNIVIGNNSSNSNTTGSDNIAIGSSHNDNTRGEENIAIGYESLDKNKTGSRNIAIGLESLNLNTKGSFNIAIGYSALNDSKQGSENIAIGDFAGSNSGSGAKIIGSIYLGNNTRPSYGSNISNEIVIANDATGKGSNTIVLGNFNTEENYLKGRVFLNRTNSTNRFVDRDYGLLNIYGYSGNYTKRDRSSYFKNNILPVKRGTNISSGEVSIYASNSILTNTYFQAISDRRIKNIINISDKKEDLKKLLDIEITDYTMIDNIKKGNKSFKKVIAQQIESIVPEVVTIGRGIIPNVYEVAKSVKVSNLGSVITTDKKHNFSTGDRVKLIIENKGNKGVIVKEIINYNTFLIGETLDLNEKIFVYGKEVDDFRSVDYDGLTTLNISATQAIYQEIKNENDLFIRSIDRVKKDNTILKEEIELLNRENISFIENVKILQKDLKNRNDKLKLLLERIEILKKK